MGYFLVYNEMSSDDLGFDIIERPIIPSPVKRVQEIHAPERNGTLYKELGYESIPISIDCNFYTADNIKDSYRKIKKWVNSSIDNKLRFSDDLNYFYKVEKADISGFTTELIEFGKFTINFTLDPFMYREDGLDKILISTILYNQFEECQPIYYIQGEGVLTLVVNGITIKANVGQNLIINTEKGLCYRTDGTMNNTALTGKYKDLLIKEGINTFSWTSGFTVEIVPNWREL